MIVIEVAGDIESLQNSESLQSTVAGGIVSTITRLHRKIQKSQLPTRLIRILNNYRARIDLLIRVPPFEVPAHQLVFHLPSTLLYMFRLFVGQDPDAPDCSIYRSSPF